jgi:hypothetical protein
LAPANLGLLQQYLPIAAVSNCSKNPLSITSSAAASTFVRQERVFSEAGATLVLEAVVLTLDADDGRMVQQPVRHGSPKVS